MCGSGSGSGRESGSHSSEKNIDMAFDPSFDTLNPNSNLNLNSDLDQSQRTSRLLADAVASVRASVRTPDTLSEMSPIGNTSERTKNRDVRVVSGIRQSLATAVMSVNKDNTSSSPIDCLIPDTTRTSRFFVRSLVLPIGKISDNVSGVRTDARTDATASARSRLVL